MATRLTRLLRPNSPFRPFATSARRPSKPYGPPRPHEHSAPSPYVGSYADPPPASDPREALKRLENLRRDYGRQVSACRKQYAVDVEILRQEKARKEKARREAARAARAEEKAARKEASEVRAAQRKVFREELRVALMKERAEKLEFWKGKEVAREKKMAEQRELLKKQSSMWIDEDQLQKKITDSLIDVSPL